MNTKTLIRIRIGFYTLWALAGCWNTAMAGVKWASMGWEEQSCLVGGMILYWSGIMMAYFDKSMWRYDEEKRLANGNGKPASPPNLPAPPAQP